MNQYGTETRPIVLLFVGLPGSGKTTVAQTLAVPLSLPVLTTETVRAQLFDEEAIHEDRDFTPLELELTYRAVTIMVNLLLQVGCGAIVDGMFRSQEQREMIKSVANSNGADFQLFHVICNEEEALRRVRQRKQGKTASPSGENTYYSMKRIFEAVKGDHMTIDTNTTTLPEQLEHIRNTVRILNLPAS